MLNKNNVIYTFIFLSSFNCFGQYKDSTSEFKFSGYVDAYYAYYNDDASVNKYQQFPSISPKSNEFGINVAQLTGQYTSSKARAIITLHYGDLPKSAWSPDTAFNIIQEANIGLKLCKKIWVDAGFFKTHIGTEALLPKDNITSSISIITLYEPWFQSGIKITYQPNDKYLFCLHLLNGYNIFIDNNKKKSVGGTFVYNFNDRGSIGYYNLIGDEKPDSLKTSHVRFLNNLVFNYQITPKLKTVIGVDYIGQQNSGLVDSSKYASIYSAIVILKYQIKPKIGIFGRFEMFNDADGILSNIITDYNNKLTGYKLTGYTLGIEAKITDNSYIRLESRDLIMDDTQKIFYNNGKYNNNRLEVMLNIGVWF